MSCPPDEELREGGAKAREHARDCPRCQAALEAADTLDATIDSQKTLQRDRPADASVYAGAAVGPYVVSRRLGAGAMGVVYAAWDPRLEREVALKVLHVGGDLVSEARLLARLNHPNVVTVHEVFSWQERLVLVMEFARGLTLREWLRAAPRTQAQVRDVFTQCARGLAAAHAQGIVHRDFKPDNVLVDETGRARLLDFGLATPEHAGAAGLAGSPAYMALSQLQGAPADAASDQFAWWASLHEAVVGRVPHGAPTLAGLIEARRAGPVDVSALPRTWRGAVARGLSNDPRLRYPSMDAAARALAPSRLGRWAALGASVLLSAAAAVWLGQPPPPCALRSVPVDAWAARAREPALSAAVTSWLAGQTACLALPEAEQRATAACLEQAGQELDVALEALEVSPRFDAALAPRVLRRVMPAERCARRPLPPPARLDGDRAALVDSLRAQLRFDALRLADDTAGALKAAREHRSAVDRGASPTARAWAGFNEAAAASATGDVGAALTTLRRLQALPGLGPREQAWIALGRWLFECHASAAEHCAAAEHAAQRLVAEVDEPWLRAFDAEVTSRLDDAVSPAQVLAAWRAIPGAEWEAARSLDSALTVALVADDLEARRQLRVLLPGVRQPSQRLRRLALQFEVQEAIIDGDLSLAAERLRALEALAETQPEGLRAVHATRRALLLGSGKADEALALTAAGGGLRRNEELLFELSLASVAGSPGFDGLAAQVELIEPQLSGGELARLEQIRLRHALARGDAKALAALPVEPKQALLRAWQLAVVQGDARAEASAYDAARKAGQKDPVARVLLLEEAFAARDFARVAREAEAERRVTPSLALSEILRALEAAARWRLGERDAACRVTTHYLRMAGLTAREFAEVMTLLRECPTIGLSPPSLRGRAD